jgi:hypothetical protein
MINFQPSRTHNITPDSSFLAQRWEFLDDQAVSYRHGVFAASSSLVPIVRLLQAEIEALERERDALLSREPLMPRVPEHFVIPLPPVAEVRGRITEVTDAPFLFFDDDD